MKTTRQYGLLVMAIVGVLTGGQAMAAVVDFIASEGYVDGDLTNSPAWSGADAGNIVSTTGAGYSGALGIVTLATSADWVEEINANAVALTNEGSTVTISSRFQYSTSGAVVGGNYDIYSMQIFDDAIYSITNEFIRVGLRRDPLAENIRFVWGVSGLPISGLGASIAETNLGLTYLAADTSDWLELTVTLRKGATTNDWLLTGVITNLDTGTQVMNIPVNTLIAPTAAMQDDPNVYGAINSSISDATTGLFDRFVDTFGITAGFAGPPPPPPLISTYDFSDTNKYTDGVLLGQDGWDTWNGATGANVISNGVLVLSTTAEWRQNWQTRDQINAMTNDTFYCSAVFSFSETGPYIGVEQHFMNVQLNDSVAASGGFNTDPMRLRISRDATNDYGIVLFTNIKTGTNAPPGNQFGYATCKADKIGLDLDADVDLDSDLLELALTLTKGTNEYDWGYLLELKNLNTAETVISSAGTMNTDTDLFTSATLAGGITSGQMDGNGASTVVAITNRVVYSATIGIPTATPTCAAPTLSITRSGADVNVSWDSSSGCSYQLQVATPTLTGGWSDLGSPVAGDGTTKTLPVLMTGVPQYFRMVIP